MTIQTFEIGNHVECDSCGKDFTDSTDSGGFIFCSSAYGPCCSAEQMKSIESYGEQRYIKAICPPDMSFRDFVLQYRDGNNSIKVLSGEDAMKAIFGVLKS